MRKKRITGNYQYRLSAIRRRLNIRLDEPEECLDILEKIIKKGRPVARNLIWCAVDEKFNSLVGLNRFKYEKRYNKIIERAEVLDKPLKEEIMKDRDLGWELKHLNEDEIGYIGKTGRIDRHSLELARGY